MLQAIDRLDVSQGVACPNHLLPVERLLKLCNPFLNPPWAEVASLSVEGIRAAVQDGFVEPRPYSERFRTDTWTVEDHIARIAYLVIHGWDDAIELDVGVPSLNCWVEWPIIDGNHRFAAAVVRGDTHIAASWAGSLSLMEELFGELVEA